MSSSSREYSPDWLRNVQAPPTTSIWTLSSSSESNPCASPVSEDEKDDQLPISSAVKKTSQVRSPSKKLNTKKGSKADIKVAKGKTAEKEPKSSVWALPSDSEHESFEHETSGYPKDEDKDDVDVSSSLKGASKMESPKKRLKLEDTETKSRSLTKQENDDDDDLKVLERETTEKQAGPYISSSRLPLVLADKVQRSKALVECEGESIDLSGDLGSVGRVVISDSPSGNQDMLLDLKGTIYKTTIIPSRTFCVVSFGQSEAKIEAIMNDFIQLEPQSNVYEAETMVEGTLEGFSFESEDEYDGDKHTSRQTEGNEGGELQNNGKGRRKSEKTSIQEAAAKRKGKTAVKKPAKKVKRKAPVAKKTKAKK